MNGTLSELIEERCLRYSDRVLAYDGRDAPVGFRAFHLTILTFAERLAERGVSEGSTLALTVPDILNSMAVRLAALRLGATVLGQKPQMLRQRLGIAPDFTVHLGSPADPAPGDIVIDETWAAAPAGIPPISGRGQLVRGTSGTTGTPKLRLMTDAQLRARIEHGLRHRGGPEGPAYIGYAPRANPAFNLFVRMLVTGHPQVHQQADPAASLAAIARHRVASVYVPPLGFQELTAAARSLRDSPAHRPETLQQIVCGGGALSAKAAEMGEALFGCPVISTYGSNETSSIASHRPATSPDQPGIVGRIYKGMEVRFVDRDGQEADPATGGLIHIRVPAEFRGVEYPSMAPVCDPEGWVSTGDVGAMLPGGRLRLSGRVSELLNIGGNKVAPVFFEELARTSPLIEDVAAFRAPMPSGADHVGLAVVPAPGFDLAAFGRFMQEKLGPMYPMHIATAPELPYTEAGKIDRGGLTRLFTDALEASLKNTPEQLKETEQ